MKMKLKSKQIGGFLFLLLFLYFIIIAIKITNYSNKDDTQKADVAIVLGASIWNSEPSPVFKKRINHSIDLYKNGIVNKIIFTGGKADEKQYSESYVAKIYAEKLGVKSEDILIEEESKITQENLVFAKKLMAENNLSKALLVSDPLHMKRTVFIAKDLEINAYSSPTKSSKYISKTTKLKFLMRETFFYITYQVYRIFS